MRIGFHRPGVQFRWPPDLSLRQHAAALGFQRSQPPSGAGKELYWNIDCYDMKMRFGSEDTSDPEQTTRVLTILFAEEY